MNKIELSKRYLLFIIGLFLSSFGVSFVTKASLGTSPISSIPYTLSIGFAPSLGMFTLYFSILLIMIQLILLREKFPKQYILQIPVSILFSYFIDLTMNLLSFMNPGTYFMKFILLLLGCVILGIGVFLEIVADVVMLPGESFVKAICTTFNTDFGKTKIAFDCSMTMSAVIIGFVLFHKLEGVREGTAIAAVLVGMTARVLKRKFGFIEKYLTGTTELVTNEKKLNPSPSKSRNMIITISREYGSDGRQIAEKLAKELGFAFYDKSIIEMTAQESGLTIEYIEEKEQKLVNSFLYDLVAQYYYSSNESTTLDKLFQAETKVIREVASKENCVIVGRCADYILKDFSDCYNIFLYAKENVKVGRIMKRENMNEENAKKHLRDINRKRFNHYKYYTGRIWGFSQNYNLCIDTGVLGVDETVDMIKKYILDLR